MFTLFKKDLLLFVKDRRAVLLIFLLPIILITLFAFAFGGIGNNNSPRPTELPVADLDNTVLSNEIITKLDTLKGIKIYKSDLEKSKKLIMGGKVAAALVFHKGFADSVKNGGKLPLELYYDKARTMEIGMLQPILISTIMDTIGRLSIKNNIKRYIAKNFPDINNSIKKKIIDDAINTGNNTITSDFKSTLKLTSIVGKQKENNIGLIQAVAGTAIMMLLFSIAGMSTSILEEKENGTIDRLLYSPIKSDSILYSKMLFNLFISLIQLSLMFLFSALAFGLDITINIPALLIMIFAVGFAVSGFGIFIAAISKTRQQAQSLSTLVILIMSAIGGSMIPLFLMPTIMQKIAILSVNYWGIEGFYDIFWRRLPIINILPKISVLIAIGIIMSVISVKLFKKNKVV